MGDTTRKDPAGLLHPLPAEGLEPGPSGMAVAGYELLEELGRGGMGAVYRAREPGGREVALKVLLALDDPELIERFKLEARATARLKHPRVVVVHDMGWEGGRPYLVMQWVRGDSLKTIVKRSGPFPSRRAAELTLEMAEGVAHAHEHGVLHRDLTPGNVMVNGEGHAVLTDFGLARLRDANHRLTQTGTSIGTPNYMCPEQVEGRPGDERVDVYGLGAILYHLLCGQPPYPGESAIHVMDAVVSFPLVPPSRIDEGVDARLEAICLRCLEKHPADRYPSADALAVALRAYLEGSPAASQGAPKGVLAGIAAAAAAVALALSIGAVWASRRATPAEVAARSGGPPSVAGDPTEPPPTTEPLPTAEPPPMAEPLSTAEPLPTAEPPPTAESLPAATEASLVRVDRELDAIASRLDAGGLPVGDAIAQVSALLREAPLYGRLYFARGRLQARQGAHQEALVDLRRADQVRVPYTEPDLYRDRGLLLCQAKAFEEACPDLRRACADRPRDGALAFQLGVACRESRRLEEAVRELQRAELLRPDEWRASFNLGGTLSSLGRFTEAVDAYERSHRAARSQVHWPLVRMSDSLLKLERPLEAEACLRRLLRENPRYIDDAVVDAQFARALQAQGRLEEALTYAERSLRKEINDRTATAVASIYADMGRTRDAIAILEDALARGWDTDLLQGNLRKLREGR